MKYRSNASKGRAQPYREPRHALHPVVYTLRKRRYDMGVCAESLAQRLGYSLKTMQDWECGAHVPTFRSLHVWAEGLGLELTLREKQ